MLQLRFVLKVSIRHTFTEGQMRETRHLKPACSPNSHGAELLFISGEETEDQKSEISKQISIFLSCDS